MPGPALYDRTGIGYATTRGEKPRIAHAIGEALGDAHTILNVGAGPGRGLARLRRDLRTGAWDTRHANLVQLDELDLGYRIVIAARRIDWPGQAGSSPATTDRT